MKNIRQIKASANAPIALRNIADSMEAGDIKKEDVTLIAGTDVFQLGALDETRAAEGAIFNMTMGIQKLMHPVITAGENDDCR